MEISVKIAESFIEESISPHKSASVYKSSPPGHKTGYPEIWLDPDRFGARAGNSLLLNTFENLFIRGFVAENSYQHFRPKSYLGSAQGEGWQAGPQQSDDGR